MIHNPEGRISLHANTGRVRIHAGDTLIADTRQAIELRETGYPNRQYIPRADIVMAHLSPTQTTTHCPFKGDTVYYAIQADDQTIADAAWSYEHPFEAVAPIAGHLAFDTEALHESIEPERD